MDGSMPGFSVLHHLPEFAQIRVHWLRRMLPNRLIVCRSPSPLALNLSQYQGLFHFRDEETEIQKGWLFAQGHTATNAELYQAAGSELVLLPMLRSEGCVGFNWTEGRGRGWPTQDPFSARRTEGAQDWTQLSGPRAQGAGCATREKGVGGPGMASRPQERLWFLPEEPWVSMEQF